jgi:hypothetical protein
MSVAEFGAIEATNDDFTIIYIPDTQIYSRDGSAYYADQTQWIVDNAAALNIQAVLHEGDVVDSVVQTEFDVAVAAQAILQSANIPNLIASGNHDYAGTNPAARDLTLYLTNFPASYWTGKTWFNGAMYNNEPPNMWFTRTIGSRQYLFISLEYNPRDEVLDWLDAVLTAHSSKTAFIVEHIYLRSDDVYFTEGQRLLDRLKNHSNVLLVGCGHHVPVVTDYVGNRAEWLVNGRRLFAFMCNFQGEPTTGGLGYLRIIKVKPNSNAMLVQTYSPSLDEYLIGGDEEFVWTW